MRRILKWSIAIAIVPAVAAWAGALLLDISNPESNPEAKSMHAILVATATACHEPAKSKVTASLVRREGGELRRTQLKVESLHTPGAFAILGAVPPGSVIDLAVTNPEYQNYQPRVLIAAGSHGPQWTTVRHFFGVPPGDSDVKNILGGIE